MFAQISSVLVALNPSSADPNRPVGGYVQPLVSGTALTGKCG